MKGLSRSSSATRTLRPALFDPQSFGDGTNHPTADARLLGVGSRDGRRLSSLPGPAGPLQPRRAYWSREKGSPGNVDDKAYGLFEKRDGDFVDEGRVGDRDCFCGTQKGLKWTSPRTKNLEQCTECPYKGESYSSRPETSRDVYSSWVVNSRRQ